MTMFRLIAAGLLAVVTAAPARAARDPAELCDLAAAQAARDYGVPIDILLAITRVETGRGKGDAAPWPWAINADGAGTWYATKAEAVTAATSHANDGTGTFDVGCFQLNIRWHGPGFASLDDMFDPTKNADYAARFLAQLYQENGDWAAAVSAYHSRTPDLAEAYLAKVKAILNDPEAGPVTVAEPPRENLFPLLQAGDQGSAGSIVPLQPARSPIIGGNS